MAPVTAPIGGRDDVPLGWYPTFVRRHARLLAATALVGALAGGALVIHRGRVYTATVEIIASKAPLGIMPDGAGRRVVRSTVDTEAQLLVSDAVVAPTARALGGSLSSSDIRQAIAVTVPQGTRALLVRYRSGSAAAARKGATEVARHYLALRTRLNQVQRSRAIARLVTFLDRLVVEPVDGGENASVATLNRARIRVARELEDLRATPIDPGELVSARPYVAASFPNASVPITTGGLLGLLAGVAIALGVEAKHRGVRTVETLSTSVAG